ncbi:MAG: peptidylprolyl isomerase [Akkermansiaceae bacterium]|nr:peptidylprolyl isomerase [Akkermansiaceae bacterium]MDP4646360.1 peptidylprolyl isomerase [Akkermansiaceae bacterium]MDP4721949.1 peptidylprolyl isomerase [Akkermansiaceae bacterium]MDP4779963.1 peptidylprolyl isomerase [Akkermansiaceae bacterium]MDP4847111.1 peptidylprolyl isomerase [Akkermansiaceae bacterium]
MRTFTKFSLRFAAYLLVVAYLVGDLFIFEGPLKKRIAAKDPNSPEAIAAAKANGVVARVFNHHITRSQLDYAIHERLWLEGKTLSDLTPGDTKLVTYAALGELIDHELLRVKVKVNTKELPVSEEEINERLTRFVGRFETKGHLESAMKSMGIADEDALRHRIAARIQQEKYVTMRVDPLVNVSEEEIAAFYEANAEALARPERIQARHIFLSTLNSPSEEVEAKLKPALALLKAGEKDFKTLAVELSEDSASKSKGGDLGWMSKARLPADFAEPAFAMKQGDPQLIETKIGWHLLEITDRKPAEPRTLDETREEITAAITATKRHQAVVDFRSALRRFEDAKIDIFHDQLAP